jgi:hypothetical protein
VSHAATHCAKDETNGVARSFPGKCVPQKMLYCAPEDEGEYVPFVRPAHVTEAGVGEGEGVADGELELVITVGVFKLTMVRFWPVGAGLAAALLICEDAKVGRGSEVGAVARVAAMMGSVAIGAVFGSVLVGVALRSAVVVGTVLRSVVVVPASLKSGTSVQQHGIRKPELT